MTLKELLILFLILSFALFTRLWRLSYPSAMYFDEVYHLKAASMMQGGDWQTPFTPLVPQAGEIAADWLHPPLAKYLQVLAITIFGNHALAWRLPSVIFALLTLLVFYFLVRFLGKHFFFKEELISKRDKSAICLALLATFLLSLDGLFLVQSRIAMNDVIMLFFVLLASFAYFVYLAKKQVSFLLFSGLSLGLACASKWSALWFLLLILCKEVFTLKNRKQLPFLIFVLVLTPLFIYFLAYLPLLYQENGLAQFFTLQKTMLQSQLSNPTLHAYSSRPLAWILNLRPVWYFTAVSHVSQPNWVSNIYALDNPLLHLYMILTLPVGFWYLMKNKLRATAKRGVYFLIAFYLVSFLPWLFFKRIMFFYHYLPAIPFLLILTAYFFLRLLREVKNKNNYLAIFFNVLFWPFLFFVIFYPHWTALSVPAAFAQIFYFGLASWR